MKDNRGVKYYHKQNLRIMYPKLFCSKRARLHYFLIICAIILPFNTLKDFLCYPIKNLSLS